MSSGPHRPSCLHGALGCSALPPGANCSPGCSALLPGVLCSPWALSAPPGVQCRSWCSVLPVGAQCSPLGAQRSPPRRSVLSLGTKCSPWCSVLPLVLSALPGCSVLLLVLSTPPRCSVLCPGTQRSPLGAQRSCRPGGDQPSSWVSMSSRPPSQFSVTNFSACTDSFLLTDEHTVVFSFLNTLIFFSLSSNY